MDADPNLHGPDRSAAQQDAAVARYTQQLESIAAQDSDAAKAVEVLHTLGSMSIEEQRNVGHMFAGIAGDEAGRATVERFYAERLQADAASGSATAAASQQALAALHEQQVAAAASPTPAPAPAPAPAASGIAWPVHAPVSQEFNGGDHKGIDLAAAMGTSILAATSGTIVQASDLGDGYGNCVVIRSDDGETFTRYAHQSELHVQVGQHVDLGTEIGLVGSTGQSTGPHLHFEVRIGDANGEARNPRDVIDGTP